MQQPLTAATALAVSVCCVAAANATSPTRPHLALALAGGANATTPTQLHLALAGGADVRVAWRTAAAAPSACSWGPTNASMPFAATGASVEYLPGHGFHHAVKLAPLSPSTVYWYSCGGSAPTSFTTAPPAGAPANFSAVIFGDWGYLDSTLRPPSIPVDGMDVNWTASLTRELLETLGPNGPGGAAASNDFTWIVGDIAYADDGAWHAGELFNFTYEEVYDGFVAWNENISSSVPLMVSPGNHASAAPRELPTLVAGRCSLTRRPSTPKNRPAPIAAGERVPLALLHPRAQLDRPIPRELLRLQCPFPHARARERRRRRNVVLVGLRRRALCLD